MGGNTMQRVRKHITDNEGKIPTPYKDNKGLLTVGTGFKVDDETSFVAMPFEIKDAKTGEVARRPRTKRRPSSSGPRGSRTTNCRTAPARVRCPYRTPK
ncbi:MAG: hypothetical protein ACM31L_08440 [Actinomycetota bacterium]